jgi:flagellar assembly protein FliH
MKSTAKYMFDEDFATGEKPTITVVEAERRRADAEAQAHRKGFAAGLAQAQTEAAQRMAVALGLIADGMTRLDRDFHRLDLQPRLDTVERAATRAA